MCKRRDSIAAQNAAADRLAEACEAKLHAAMNALPADPVNPAHSGTARAIRKAFSELAATPADMAVTLGQIVRKGEK